MSGVKNLANAIANDPSFTKETGGLMNRSQADELVCDPKRGGSGSGKSAPKAKRGY